MSNQADLLIRRSERLIIKKIYKFRASFYGVDMIDAVKKINTIFMKFRQYTRLQKEIIINI